MYKKLDCYINGVYCFSTTKYKTCKELKNHIRSVKHILVASIPNKYITVYDYDTLSIRRGN